ncbi:hypothetical protein Saa2_07622 [Streptomyces acidiscabies]|nr:hypothetical protein Saa2_07622 [Streptomyces acidiscabies]
MVMVLISDITIAATSAPGRKVELHCASRRATPRAAAGNVRPVVTLGTPSRRSVTGKHCLLRH